MSNAKKILLVEDSKSVRLQVSTVLSDSGYTIIQAENGVRGLELIQQNSSELSLVIADINMPLKGGLDMIEEARKEILAGLPVIMLTTEGRPEYIKRAKAAGAKGWLVKPFKSERLIATVEKLAR